MSLRRLNLVLLLIASVALFLMFRGIDWPGLIRSLLGSKRYWPLLVVPYGVTCCFWTLSWSLLLVNKVNRPSLRRLFVLRLGGEALNQLTPTGSLGGEPFKAVRLVSAGVPWQEAAASLVIHKAVTVLSLVLYIVTGLALLPVVLPAVPPRLAFFSCLGTLLLALGGTVFMMMQRGNPCALLLRGLKRLGLCPAVLASKEGELATLDDFLAVLYRDRSGAIVAALLISFVGWLAHAVEAYLIFRLLGRPLDPAVALCVDALAQLFAAVGFMIPASLGVQDGGNILISLGFRLGATMGAGFSVLRRFREAVWLLPGLLVVVKEK